MKPLPYVHDKNFNAVFFRRQTTQLMGNGGLWDEATALYRNFPNVRVNKSERSVTFSSGARCTFTHMEHEHDKEKHQGLNSSPF